MFDCPYRSLGSAYKDVLATTMPASTRLELPQRKSPRAEEYELFLSLRHLEWVTTDPVDDVRPYLHAALGVAQPLPWRRPTEHIPQQTRTTQPYCTDGRDQWFQQCRCNVVKTLDRTPHP